MGATITQLQISPDGKEVGFFLMTPDGKPVFMPIELASFSAAFPAMQAIYEEYAHHANKGAILTNDGKPLKVLEFIKPDEQTRVFSMICQNINGDRISMRFALDDAHKMLSGLQIITQFDKHVGAPIRVRRFSTFSDWTEEQKEHVTLQFTDENSVDFLFLFTIPQMLELLRISEETVRRVSLPDQRTKTQ